MATAYSFDGSGNNAENPDFNKANTTFIRTLPENLGPDGSLPDGPNPRAISNTVVAAEPEEEFDPALSGYMYAWGQFADHDLDLQRPGLTRIDITVPDGDPTLPSDSTIPLTRSVADDGLAFNQVTGWLDASQVYGSDATTAAFLRGENGRLLEGQLGGLPVNDAGVIQAGDVRAAENPNLTAIHTLIAREHNFQVEQLEAAHPDWTSDELYHTARAIVTAETQNITTYQYLPHLLGANAIDPYRGYDPTVDPRISQEFAGAAFRFGHSLVSPDIITLDNNGVVTSEANLADVFFEPAEDIDGLLRNLASEHSQAADAHIIDELRNALVDPPDSIDLAAVNIQRGRDLGLATLNDAREALGFDPYTSFDQISDDPATNEALAAAYASPDDVELWVGGLAEADVPGGILGPVFTEIIADQFTRLRAGDANWFENDQFDDATLEAIRDTTLADIIARNTDTIGIQNDVFVAAERQTISAEDEPDDPAAAPEATSENGKEGEPEAVTEEVVAETQDEPEPAPEGTSEEIVPTALNDTPPDDQTDGEPVGDQAGNGETPSEDPVGGDEPSPSGGSNPELIIAQQGDGEINAGGGDDTIVAAEVTDVKLVGGPGSDLFQFPTTGASVQIDDFTAGKDLLQFGASVRGFGDVKTTQQEGSLLVEAGGNTVTLSGVSAIGAPNIRFIASIDHASLSPVDAPV
jgi:peroxidase